ncbi:ABC transporter permease [Limosilactobacillus equigenerosi]|uniref:ABC transporter permease n=1 Tax=Limosilactobacillus equigenerosi TaxID=417373 RepID=UPI0006D01273|nr:ABC transporter permease [Limosilactobacillus equigenerosi]
MNQVKFKRKNPIDEFVSLTTEYIFDFLENKQSLLKIIGFPIFADAIVLLIAKKHIFDNFEDTKSAFFIIISAAIFGGIFNSISIIASDRKNIKQRAATPNFYYGSYLASRMVVQLLICIFQSFLMVLLFKLVPHDYPEHGIIFKSTLMEFWVTLLLVLYAADMLGLMISTGIKKEERASTIAPYILIVELILSGTLFKFSKTVEPLSIPMESRWGMEALGSTARLNQLTLKIQKKRFLMSHIRQRRHTKQRKHTCSMLGGFYSCLYLWNQSLRIG